jgi:hypothetical protein
MSANIEHFMKSVSQAVTKQKTKTYVQTKQAQQVVSNGGVVSTSAKITTRMSDDEYKQYIIATAVAHIIKKREIM